MLSDDLTACADIVHRGDADRFAATMAIAPVLREKLWPLYAFNIEVSRAPWVTEETMIAEMRLQWWRDALEEISGSGPVRRHEVVTPLAALLTPAMAQLLDQAVEARRWDIYRDPFEDAAHFERYIDQTSGNLMLVAAQLLGEAEEAPVRDLAYGFGVARWLLAIPELEARKRVPLLDGRPEAVAALARGALDRLANARRQGGGVSTAAGKALLPAWRSEALLKQAVTEPQRVADGNLMDSEFTRRWGLLWRSMSGRW